MAFSAAFTGALVAPVISMGVSHVFSEVRVPQFPKDVFDQDQEDNLEEEDNEIIETKTSKSSYEKYKRTKTGFDNLSSDNRRNTKYQEFSTTEDTLNIYE